MTNSERIKAIYSIVRKIIAHPSSLFLVLEDETEHEKYLKKKYNRTVFPSIEIDDILESKKGSIDNYTFLDGSSLVTDLLLLKSLAEQQKDCNYLEIGTWRGESILNVASTGAKCTSVSLSPQEIIEIGIPPKYAELQACLIKDEPNILQIHANSLHFDFSTLNQKYDLIFVDGDHSYKAIKSDTEKVFRLLKDENSIIVWHDYGFNTEKPRHSVIAAILDGMPKEVHTDLYHVSNTMCAIFTRKKWNAKLLESPTFPNKTFKIAIEINPFQRK